MPKKLFLTNLQHFELSQFLSQCLYCLMGGSAYFVKSTSRAFSIFI